MGSIRRRGEELGSIRRGGVGTGAIDDDGASDDMGEDVHVDLREAPVRVLGSRG